MAKNIALIGTLDTKANTLQYLRDRISQSGFDVLLIDTSCKYNMTNLPKDISCIELAQAGGNLSFQEVAKLDRKAASSIIASGARSVLERIFSEKRISGCLAVGGSNGTYIACKAMRALPHGFPKVMISTMASSNMRPYIRSKDIAVFNPVGDIYLNHITKKVFNQAANAAIAMVRCSENQNEEESNQLIGITMFGVTEPCSKQVGDLLQQEGYEVCLFHTNGAGGEALEQLIKDGEIDGVVDISISELPDLVFGGVFSAGEGRLKASSEKRPPRVIVPGASEFVNFWKPSSIPKKYYNERFLRYNSEITLMRLDSKKAEILGEEFAKRVTEVKYPLSVLIPCKGFSELDREDGPETISSRGAPLGKWFSPEANSAFIDSLKRNCSEHIELLELDFHINDYGFAKAVYEKFLDFQHNLKCKV